MLIYIYIDLYAHINVQSTLGSISYINMPISFNRVCKRGIPLYYPTIPL